MALKTFNYFILKMEEIKNGSKDEIKKNGSEESTFL